MWSGERGTRATSPNQGISLQAKIHVRDSASVLPYQMSPALLISYFN